MTSKDTFGRDLSAWLREDGEHHVPDHLAEALVRTRATRQRPWWSSPERWLPVDTTLRFAPAPRLRWLLVVLAVVIALALAIVVGVGSQRRLPPPFGIAANGSIVYALADGDIYALDRLGGSARPIIAGPENDRSPRISSDGTHILFDREVGSAQHQLMIANADGSAPRPLTPPIPNVDSIAWSPDGTRVSMSSDTDAIPALRIAGLDGSLVLVLRQEAGTPAEALEDAQWRPDGREIVFRGWRNDPPSFGLYAIRPDGSGMRPILPAQTSMDRDFIAPTLSPDGRQIAYSLADHSGIRIVDVDTGRDGPVALDGPTDSDDTPVWSPDGTRFAFLRSLDGRVRVAVAAASGGPVSMIGPSMPVKDGVALAFSPDGQKIVARYAGDGSTWILDAAGTSAQQLEPGIGDLASWQRLAP